MSGFVKLEEIYEIYAKYYNELYVYIFTYVANHEDTKDILHDCFEKIIKTISRKQTPDINQRAWLYKIARNTSINFLKKLKKSDLLTVEHEKKLIQENFSHALDNHLLIEKILNYVNTKYSSREIEVFHLRVIDNFTLEEIAQITQTSKSTIDRMVNRIVSQIKKEFY